MRIEREACGRGAPLDLISSDALTSAIRVTHGVVPLAHQLGFGETLSTN
jgi:hypothetical protein